MLIGTMKHEERVRRKKGKGQKMTQTKLPRVMIIQNVKIQIPPITLFLAEIRSTKRGLACPRCVTGEDRKEAMTKTPVSSPMTELGAQNRDGLRLRTPVTANLVLVKNADLRLCPAVLQNLLKNADLHLYLAVLHDPDKVTTSAYVFTQLAGPRPLLSEIKAEAAEKMKEDGVVPEAPEPC
jgi:hypothetical protein